MTAHALADADGMSADEARAAARRRMGDPLRLREQSRDAWTFAAPRLRTVRLALFATCGLHGLVAYTVAQRRLEIGVRMALGAEPCDVLRLVLARARRIVVAG